MFFNKKKKKKVVFNNKKAVTDKTVFNKNLKFFNWIQEFSKKIVIIAFVIYILMDIISLAMVIMAYIHTGDLMYIDTIIMEANQTFRDVIGGYIIKAATENVSKGLSMIMSKYLDIREKEFEILHPEYQEYIEDEDPERDGDGYDV